MNYLILLLHTVCFSLAVEDNFDKLYKHVTRNDVAFRGNVKIGRCVGHIVEEYFRRRQYVAILLAIGNRNRCEALADSQQQGVINQIVVATGKTSALTIVTDPDVSLEMQCENFIIVSDTAKNFVDSIADIPPLRYTRLGNVIIVISIDPGIPKKVSQNVDQILAACWKNGIVHVVLIVPINGNPTMFTYFPFLLNKCRNSNAVLINRWQNDTMSRKNNLFPPQARQLYGCELRVTLIARYPHTIIEYNANGEMILSGVEAHLLRMLAGILNFTLVTFEPEDRQRWGLFNGTGWTGAAGDLVYDRADIGAGENIPSLAKLHILDISVGYDTVYLGWGIPRFEKYSMFVKMFLPFKKYIWLLSISTTLGLILLFFYLKNRINNTTVQVSYVGMSIWQLTFGYPVDKMPSGRFAVFVFTVWMWMSMVLRNSYQGALVGFLTNTFYSDGVYSMKDMLDAGFNFYGLSTGMDYFKNVTDDDVVKQVYKSFILLKNMTELDDAAEMAYWKNDKSAFFFFPTHINEINYKRRINLRFVEEVYRSQIITLAYKKQSMFLRQIDKWILRISEAGFIDQWDEDFAYPEIPPTEDPIQIKLKHLTSTFIILAIGEAASIVLFLLELVLYKYGGKYRRILDNDP